MEFRPFRDMALLRSTAAIIVAFVLVFASAGQYAFADVVMNDVVAGGNDTITVGGSTTINYSLIASNIDPSGDANGCNATGSNPATGTVTAPPGVSVSGSPFTIIGCGNDIPVTFSSSTPGDYSITIGVTGGKSGSGYNTSGAAFTLYVLAAPSTDTTTPTTISVLDPSSPDGSNGWYVSPVDVTLEATDNPGGSGVKKISYELDGGSTVTVLGGSTTFSVASDGEHTVTFRAEDNDGNVESPDGSVSFKIDQTDPTINGAPTTSPNANGWYKTDVTIAWTTADSVSGVDPATDPDDSVISTEGTDQTASASVSDLAGNSASATSSPAVNIDETAPSVSLVGGPADGGSYFYGFVPAAPTCNASDALSGLDGSCSVSGYSNGIGSHTVTASATDKAGNTNSASATYTILAWTLNGFYQPVDMSSGVYNTVKGGSTVPLKFEVFAGDELTNPATTVKSFVANKIACEAGTDEDTVDFTTSGKTELRYDATSGQFIQNWQTPKSPGSCYKVTMTTWDYSTLVAFFKLK